MSERWRSTVLATAAGAPPPSPPPPLPPPPEALPVAVDDPDNDDDDADEHFPTRFASWELLEAHVREFAAHAYQAFRVRSTVSVRARNAVLERQTATKKKQTVRLPDAWRFYSKTYTCTHGLSYTPSERRRQKPAPLAVRASVGCSARINASVAFDRMTRAFCVRSAVRGQHNHPLGRAQFYSYVENRRICDPALLALIAERAARGERAQTIFAAAVKHVEDTTGAECVFQLQDVRNAVLRLQSEKRKKRACLALPTFSPSSSSPGAAGASVESFGYETLLTGARVADAEEMNQEEPEAVANGDEGDEEEEGVDSEDSSDVHHHQQQRASKRPFRMISGASELAAGVPRVRMKLSRLEMLLDSGFCFALSHQYINCMDVVAVEAIPGGITRFQHSVVLLPPDFRIQDVDFVLPQYVADGCEKHIVDACHRRQLSPSSVGVALSVQRRDSRQPASTSVMLTARQVKVMKRYYTARELMRQVQNATNWLNATGFGARPACAPFDDCFDLPKELFTYPLSTMPLIKVNVSGVSRSPNGTAQFTDSVYAPNVLNLGGGGDIGPDTTTANIDAECVKAVLLHMHARFHSSTSFACPTFVGEANAGERRRIAALYGAFVTPKQFTAGVVQLPSSLRWGGFVFDSNAHICHVYTSRTSEYSELQALVSDLWQSFGANVAFVVFPACVISDSAMSPAASGILALYFVELVLCGKSWTDVSIDSIDYLRSRYLLQAIRVVSKQDVHLIQ